MAFDIKNTPILPFISNLAGFITKETSTDVDNNILEDIKAALEQASEYEGDLSDIIKEAFDVVEWATETFPVFQKTVADDILVPIVEDAVLGLITGDGYFGILGGLVERIRANKAKRVARRDARKAKRK